MDSKRRPQASSSDSEESSSSSSEGRMEVDKNKKDLLRSDDDSEEEDDDDEGEGEVGVAGVTKLTQEFPEDFTSESNTSSASGGKPPRSSNEFIVLSRKPEPSGKSTSMEKVSKHDPKEMDAKPTNSDVLKRANAGESDRKASAKKQKKEIAARSSKSDESPIPPTGKATKKQEKKSALKNVSGMGQTTTKSASSALQVSKVLETNSSLKKSEAEKSGNIDKQKRNVKPEKIEKPAKSEKLEKEDKSAEKIDRTEKGQTNKKNSKDSQEPFSPKPKLWTPKEEILLVEILNSTRQGMEIPSKKTDEFWANLIANLQGKLEGWSKEQIFEKVRRMRTRYFTVVGNINNTEKQFKFRNANDEEIFGLCDQIWGSGHKAKIVEKETDEMHKKTTSPARPIKGKILHEGLANHNAVPIDTSKGIKSKKSDNLKEISPKRDDSEEKVNSDDSEETDKHTSLQENKLKVIEMDLDHNGIQNVGDNYKMKSLSDTEKSMQRGIRESYSGLLEDFMQKIKFLQIQILGMAEIGIKTAAAQFRAMNGFSSGLQGLDYFPAGSTHMMSLRAAQDDEAFHQQWLELQLQEVDVYQQRLKLLEKECQVMKDQIKLQILQLQKRK